MDLLNIELFEVTRIENNIPESIEGLSKQDMNELVERWQVQYPNARIYITKLHLRTYFERGMTLDYQEMKLLKSRRCDVII